MAKKKEEAPPAGSPAWMATFSDLMNLLLCFFVLLFSMSSIDNEKWIAVAASFNQTFSIFSGGATSIGEGILISNGVSQLNELSEYINSTGMLSDSNSSEQTDVDNYDAMLEALEQVGLEESEELAEKIEESIAEGSIGDVVSVEFTAQYVQLTLKGALLFDPGKAIIRDDALPVLDKVGVILTAYAGSIIEIEGHTDNVPMSSKNYSSNSELSCARALSVFDYFLDTTNLDPSMIKYSGRGEYAPVADNSTEEGRARNRRVEIRIYNDMSAYR